MEITRMALDPITEIAGAIKQIASAFSKWFEKVDVRAILKEKKKYQEACDIADKIFQTDVMEALKKNDKDIKKLISKFYDELS